MLNGPGRGRGCEKCVRTNPAVGENPRRPLELVNFCPGSSQDYHSPPPRGVLLSPENPHTHNTHNNNNAFLVPLQASQTAENSPRAAVSMLRAGETVKGRICGR